MAGTNIQWPINPVYGDNFTSSYGRTWWWDGCGWVSSCCPPVFECDPAVEGITLMMSFDLFDYYGQGITNFIFNLYPSGINQWESGQGSGSNELFFFNPILIKNQNRWEIYSSGNLLSYSYDLYGPWETYNGDFTVNFYTQCSLKESICAQIQGYGKTYNIQLNPIISGEATINDVPDFYGSFDLVDLNESFINIGYDTVENGWIAFMDLNESGVPQNIFAFFEGPSTILPSGEWTIIQEGEIISFSTSPSVEACPCDPDVSGVSLVFYYTNNDPDFEGFAKIHLIQDQGSGGLSYSGGPNGILYQIIYNPSTQKWEFFYNLTKGEENSELIGEWEGVSVICGGYTLSLLLETSTPPQEYVEMYPIFNSLDDLIPAMYYGKNLNGDYVLLKKINGEWEIVIETQI